MVVHCTTPLSDQTQPKILGVEPSRSTVVSNYFAKVTGFSTCFLASPGPCVLHSVQEIYC